MCLVPRLLARRSVRVNTRWARFVRNYADMLSKPLGFAALVVASASFVLPARAEGPPPAPPSCEAERAAWQKDPKLDPSTALAACELRAEHYLEAARVIAPFVSAGAGTVPERRRTAKISDAARAQVLTVKVEVDVLDAEVLVDGTSVGRAPFPVPLFLAPGSHTITARAEGRAPVQQIVSGAAGVSTSAHFRIVPLRRDYIGFDVATTQPPPKSDAKSVPLIVAGSAIAGVAFIVGATFTVLAVSQGSTVRDHQKTIVANGGTIGSCAAPTAPFADECGALHDSLTKRDSRANMAVGSFLIGGAVVGATLAYAFWPTRRNRETWTPSYGGVRVRPEPMIGAGVGGLQLRGSF